MTRTATAVANGRARTAPPVAHGKRKPVKTKRGSTDADQALGLKIRTLRAEARMSQTELGDVLGVSFQQIQKYEKGVNRITAPRLQQIATALGVNTSVFYDTDGTSLSTDTPLHKYMLTRDAIELLRATIDLNPAVRRRIIALCRTLSGIEGGDE